jgi:hypothetical protein
MAAVTTLPAAFVANTVLTAAQMNDLRGAFRVLQVVQGTTASQVSTTSTSYVTTGLTASITPSSTSSKVLILSSIEFSATAGTDAYFTIFRGTVAGTSLATNAVGFINFYHSGSGGGQTAGALSFLDSPSTTSAQVYTIGMKVSGAGTGYSAVANTTNTIILMEISA